MFTTVLIVLLVGFSLWLALGGPVPNLLPAKSRSKAIVLAWMSLRSFVKDPEIRARLDELLPLLLKEQEHGT